jgi:hypothetical protein
MAAYTTQLTSGPSLFFFGNILFYPVFASADSHRLIQKKTVFLKYIMWDFLKITIIQYADVVTVTYRRIVAVQALDEKT